MKGAILKILLVTFIIACSRAEPERASSSQKRLMISATCNVDTSLVSTIEEHAFVNLGTTFRRGDCLALTDPEFDDIVRAAFKSTQPEDLYTLFLYDLPTNKVNVTIYTFRDRLAFLNLDRLRRGTPRLGDDDERFERRVKKESMRALGTLIKLPKCPSYMCAMYAPGGTNCLDKKGWNLCPPHRIKSDTLLDQAGIDVKTVVEQALELYEQKAPTSPSD